MTQYLNIHPQNPQQRLIDKVVKAIEEGGIVALPTDTSYVLACALDNSSGHERLRKIRQLSDKHLFSLLCADFSQISEFAMMDDKAFRLMKSILPGAYTVVLQGNKNLGRKLCHPQRKTVGVRIPNHRVLMQIIISLGKPLIATTLNLPDEEENLSMGYEVFSALENQIEVVVDCDENCLQQSTVINLTVEPYECIREGVAAIPW